MMVKSEQILKNHNLRVTQFRMDVIDIFSEYPHALSSNDIESKLREADRITLYRTLKSFEDKGIIHKAIDGTATPKYAICEGTCSEHDHHDEHVHFHCVSCENTFCMDHVYVPQVKLPTGFLVNNTNMIVNGTCQKCRI